MTRKSIRGEEIAPGIASGTLCFGDVDEEAPPLREKRVVHDTGQELERLEREFESVIRDLTEAVSLLRLQAYHQEADLVETHIFMLQDEEFRKRIYEKITLSGLEAERALEHVLREMANVFEKSDNVFLSERTTDIKDIVLRLKRKLAKKDDALFEKALNGAESPVVALREKMPSRYTSMNFLKTILKMSRR